MECAAKGGCEDQGTQTGDYSYSQPISTLTVTVLLDFSFDKTQQAWTLTVAKITPQTTPGSPALPSESVVQKQQQGACSIKSHVSDATAQAIDTIDFKATLDKVIPPLLNSIAASGKLTPDITYVFGLGDAGLKFPNDQGIAIGATGAVKYKETPYGGTPPSNLPVPPIPTDKHYMNLYVSDYEINALYWAFYEDGKLTVTLQPADIPDPDLLKVSTYSSHLSALKPWETKSMQALVQPLQAPTVAFQAVYIFSDANMATLQKQLPSNIYQILAGNSFDGNYYADKADLETALQGVSLPNEYFATIEKVTEMMGVAVTHNIQFTFTIEYSGSDPAPYFEFTVARTDILTNLRLGTSAKDPQIQTLLFSFEKATAPAARVSFNGTNIPKLAEQIQHFGFDTLWTFIGEPNYDKLLTDVGNQGVALPIMKGFQFLFEKALLNLEEGYVSVLADVEWKSSLEEIATWAEEGILV
jgi:hypothetical protein